jgi:hypothetical protein
MSVFAYVMAALFILVWIVLLFKFIRVVSGGKKKIDEEDGQD